jgi:hypothetical protein
MSSADGFIEREAQVRYALLLASSLAACASDDSGTDHTGLACGADAGVMPADPCNGGEILFCVSSAGCYDMMVPFSPFCIEGGLGCRNGTTFLPATDHRIICADEDALPAPCP